MRHVQVLSKCVSSQMSIIIMMIIIILRFPAHDELGMCRECETSLCYVQGPWMQQWRQQKRGTGES